MSFQPRFDGRGLLVGQKIDDPALLQIAHQRAVALNTLPRKVVDPDKGERGCPDRRRATADDPQQSILTDWQHETASKAGRRAPAQGDPEMMDAALQPRRAPCGTRGDGLGQWLCEDHPRKASVAAPEPAHSDPQMHGSPMGRKIHQPSIVATMNLPRSPAAFRASHLQAYRTGDNQEAVVERPRPGTLLFLNKSGACDADRRRDPTPVHTRHLQSDLVPPQRRLRLTHRRSASRGAGQTVRAKCSTRSSGSPDVPWTSSNRGSQGLPQPSHPR